VFMSWKCHSFVFWSMYINTTNFDL
jgi:hypothetical protein